MIKCMCLVQVHFGLFIFGSINFGIFVWYDEMYVFGQDAF